MYTERPKAGWPPPFGYGKTEPLSHKGFWRSQDTRKERREAREGGVRMREKKEKGED